MYDIYQIIGIVAGILSPLLTYFAIKRLESTSTRTNFLIELKNRDNELKNFFQNLYYWRFNINLIIFFIAMILSYIFTYINQFDLYLAYLAIILPFIYIIRLYISSIILRKANLNLLNKFTIIGMSVYPDLNTQLLNFTMIIYSFLFHYVLTSNIILPFNEILTIIFFSLIQFIPGYLPFISKFLDPSQSTPENFDGIVYRKYIRCKGLETIKEITIGLSNGILIKGKPVHIGKSLYIEDGKQKYVIEWSKIYMIGIDKN